MHYYRHSTAKTLTAVIFMTVLIALSTSMASAALPALDETQRAVLTGIPEDPAPKSLVRGNHYVISNEDRPHLFLHALDKRGGVMAGVGTDQLYVYAGWARSELLIPMDFDRTVVDLHRIYALLFTKAPTPAEFIQLWHKRNAKTVRGWLDTYEADPVLRERLGYAFKIGRQLVYARLKRLHRQYKGSSTPTFVSDQAQYDHLVDLIKSGRFHPVRGDLTKTGCMKGMGEALVKLGHTLDVIYLSNAEQYFDFKQPFRDNFLNLPIDDSSLVLRTSPRNGGKGQYRYETQRTIDFQAWLKRPKVKRVKQIRRHRTAGPDKDTFIFPAPAE